MNLSQGQIVRLALTLAVALGCLMWVLWGLDLGALLAEIGQVPLWTVAGAVLMLSLSFTTRVVRFHLLLGEHAPPPWRTVVACGIGYMALNVVPLRLGELVRPVYLERDGVSWGTSVGAIAIERIYDLLALLFMLGLCATVVDVPGTVVMGGVDVLVAGQRAVGVMVVVMLAGLAVVAVAAPALEGWLRSIPVIGDRVAAFALRFREAGADLLRKPVLALSLGAVTCLVWGGSVGVVAVLLHGFEGLPTGWGEALFVNALTVAGAVAVPTPGSFGPFEAVCQASLGLWGVAAVKATAFAGVWHLHVFGFHVALGAALLGVEGVSLAALVREGVQRESWTRRQ